MMDKKYLWSILGVAAVIVIIWGLARSQSSNPSDYGTNASPSPRTTAKSSPGASSSSQPSATNAALLNYGDSLKKYAGHVIQFDARCQATPGALTVKNGTYVMFDNRSGDARTIKLDNVSYYFAGYGFRILPMINSTLPHSTVIDCGSAQNVGTITIQK